jgi:hypothetical protein
MNQLAAQASQALAGTTARVLLPSGALRCALAWRLAGWTRTCRRPDVDTARVPRDMAVIQVLAGRPW